LAKSLRRVPWQLIIADEAQYAKNASAVRTVALYGAHASGHGLVQSTQRVWLLSGGLTPNNPAELWPHLHALCPAAIGHANLHQFTERYCITRETDFGPQIVGAKNTDELLAILNSIRLARSARLLNLPPLTFGEIVLEPTQVVSRAMAHACGIYATEAQQLAAVQDADELEALSNQPSALRHEVGRIKAPMIANMMTEELHHYDHKLILFGWHIDVLDYLAQQLAEFGVVRVIGADSATARERAKLAFQSEPGVRVFIGQIIAGGLGIDLTASNQVVFAELSWSPLDNLQAAKRPHRIGQIWPCYARSISLANSLDERIDAVLMRKLKMINALHNVENRHASTPFRG
jgi:SNF2 family DNA or RNA helicase